MANIDQLIAQLVEETRKSNANESDEKLNKLVSSVIDQNEELLATYVEGTKRTIKSNQIAQDLLKDVSVSISEISKKLDNSGNRYSDNIQSIERAIKSQKQFDFRGIEDSITGIEKSVRNFRLPTEATKPIAVRISNGKEFIDVLRGIADNQKVIMTGGGGRIPLVKSTSNPNVEGVPVLNADGSDISGGVGGGGDASAANQLTIIGHIDGLEGLLTTVAGAVSGSEMQVDVITMPTVTVQATNLDIRDLTSVSDSVSAVQSGTWNVTTFPQWYNGAAFEAFLGTAANGLDVDVTRVQGTVAVTQSGTWDEVGINDSGNSITVDNGGTFVVQENGAALTSLQLIDDTVYASDAAISKVIGIGGQFDDTSPGTTTENAVRALRMSTRRELYVQVRDAAGNERGLNIDSNGALAITVATIPSHAVTNAGTFVVQENGSALTALQLIDDIVYTDDTSTHSTGSSKGALIMAAATPTDGSVNANDIGAVAMTTDRKLHVSVQDALPAGTNAIGKLAANSGVDIGDVDVTSIIPGTGATNLGKAEDGGHTSGDTGVMMLGVRTDTPNAARADTNLDYIPFAAYRDGSLRTFPIESDFAVLGGNQVKKYYTNSGAVTDGIIWSPAAGARWYVTDIYLQTSAAATVTLEDDKSGGDEVVWKGEIAANGGWSHAFTTPLFSGEDAADLIITTSAGNIYVMVTGYEI